MTVRRYVGLLLPLQLAAAARKQARAPPVEQATRPSRRTRPQPQGDEQLVLAFGDSLYAGYGVGQDESFPAALERALEERGMAARSSMPASPATPAPAAGRGSPSRSTASTRKPDLAIVGLGGNDVLRGLDPAETRANLDAILAELKRRGIPVVLTGMMAPRNMGQDYVRSFDRIYPDLAKNMAPRSTPSSSTA